MILIGSAHKHSLLLYIQHFDSEVLTLFQVIISKYVSGQTTAASLYVDTLRIAQAVFNLKMLRRYSKV